MLLDFLSLCLFIRFISRANQVVNGGDRTIEMLRVASALSDRSILINNVSLLSSLSSQPKTIRESNLFLVLYFERELSIALLIHSSSRHDI